MKPYNCNRPGNKHVGCCCAGHDGIEAVTKWVGSYGNNRSKAAIAAAKRAQARSTRRAIKLADARIVRGD